MYCFLFLQKDTFFMSNSSPGAGMPRWGHCDQRHADADPGILDSPFSLFSLHTDRVAGAVRNHRRLSFFDDYGNTKSYLGAYTSKIGVLVVVCGFYFFLYLSMTVFLFFVLIII